MPGPTDGGGDDGGIDLGGGDTGGGGNPSPEAEPEPEEPPAPALVIGGGVDAQTSGVVTGQTTEPAPIVTPKAIVVVAKPKAAIVADTPDVDRAPSHTLVFR